MIRSRICYLNVTVFINKNSVKNCGDNIPKNAPVTLARELINMCNNTICQFFLSGFNCQQYVPEWDALYVSVVEYVASIYQYKIVHIHREYADSIV